MIDVPRERGLRAWLKKAAIGAAALGFVALLGGTAAEIAARCQCHYTSVLFAEKEGLRRLELPISVSPGDRRQFIARLEQFDVFVDPGFRAGASSVPVVYAAPEEHGRLTEIARGFAQGR